MAEIIDRNKVKVMLTGAKHMAPKDVLLRIELDTDRNGQFYGTMDRVGNNEPMWRTSESYVRKEDAEYACALLIYQGLKCSYTDKTVTP
jgi:hypothetical protein